MLIKILGGIQVHQILAHASGLLLLICGMIGFFLLNFIIYIKILAKRENPYKRWLSLPREARKMIQARIGTSFTLTNNQVAYMLKVINEEIKNARQKNGLKMSKKDIWRDKFCILAILENNLANRYDMYERKEELLKQVQLEAGVIFKETKNHYPEKQNQYQEYIDSLLNRLSKDILDKKCIGSMRYDG